MHLKLFSLTLLAALYGCDGSETTEPQQIQRETEAIALDEGHWSFENQSQAGVSVVEIDGEQALLLDSDTAEGDAIAMIDGGSFTNGIIEFDVRYAKSDYPLGARAFVASIFRVSDDESSYEKFYTRPHRLTNEADGMQMATVRNHWSSWQLYWNDHVASYAPLYDEWRHIKLLVQDGCVEVYADEATEPNLRSYTKLPIQAGGLGLKVDGSAANRAYFKNFGYEEKTDPGLSAPCSVAIAPEGTVTQWQVSNTFPANVFTDANAQLPDPDSYSWEEASTDAATGVMNLAGVHHINSTPPGPVDTSILNTAFIRTSINSNIAQHKPLSVGVSDIGRVYLNGCLLFSEDNTFRSRNQYHMGTLNYVSKVMLPLQEGDNELWIAATGLRASWGAQARFDDLENISLDAPITPTTNTSCGT